jgi:hypothetical protein
MKRSQYRQGDVLLIPIDKPPLDAHLHVDRIDGRLVLAEGEATGHAHTIVDESAELVTADQAAELYLLVHGTDPVHLVHQEHDTIPVEPGAYRVVRQREYQPDAIRNVAD